ncbi:hypothetical protein [Streptomyces endophyticus]|uniref:Uncharacterized protein n=1 Tax=Streptomyces endophyticus TaxID=714166 RepID=A0ABU6F6Z3_9ACTN|nr:hypothetical protein [Streptomyces endophyticus]MEB8339764.1 hypothetical protein [Streptomyces endophyticus]
MFGVYAPPVPWGSVLARPHVRRSPPLARVVTEALTPAGLGHLHDSYTLRGMPPQARTRATGRRLLLEVESLLAVPQAP